MALNEATLLRLVLAVLSEIGDDWKTEGSYLNMGACWLASSSWHLQRRGRFIHGSSLSKP
jgi:hypothetical protein